MKSLVRLMVLGCVAFCLMGTIGYACSYDYGDATGYGMARHVTNEWQQLGKVWDAESSQKAVDTSDDGVWWSTNNGATWGHGDIYVGQTVQFRFDMHRAAYGNHEYDQLKAWLDLDGDKVWDNVGERIIGEKWLKGDTQIDDTYYKNYVAKYGVAPNPNAILDKSFYTTVVVPEDAVIGTTWLRARVSCTHTTFENTTPYGELWQGEVEDWAINIKAVPEPTTMLLFGVGLLGLCGVGRKMKK